MNIVIAGGSGLVGSALCASLQAGGHSCTILSRSAPERSDTATAATALAGIAAADKPATAAEATGSTRQAYWEPAAGTLSPAALEALQQAHGVVNLCGRDIGCRWTEQTKRQIRDSRIVPTALLAQTLSRISPRPAVLVNASAVGYYGISRPDALNEEAPSGTEGFLAEVCREWEAACAPAQAAEVRTVFLRTGVVLTPVGGALKKMLPAFKSALGGPIGKGEQWMSWISLRDLTALITFCLQTDSVQGALNATAPTPVTNAEFAAALGRSLGRPAVVPVPAFTLRLAFGQMADETLLSSIRALPEKALAAGFTFRDPRLADAFADFFPPAR